jgi:lysozyme
MTGIRTFGIDVSHYNGAIDWTAALANDDTSKVHFSFAKATELFFDTHGQVVHFKDSQFDTNWATLKSRGFPCGAYHYCIPQFSAQDMAAWFFQVYKPEMGDIIPALDVEDEYVKAIETGQYTKSQLVAQIMDFVSLVNQKIGKNPFIYIRKDITDYLGNPSEFSSCPLWLAAYNVGDPPAIPKPWSTFDFWQYSSSGSVEGVPGNCDLNYLNGLPSDIGKYQVV